MLDVEEEMSQETFLVNKASPSPSIISTDQAPNKTYKDAFQKLSSIDGSNKGRIEWESNAYMPQKLADLCFEGRTSRVLLDMRASDNINLLHCICVSVILVVPYNVNRMKDTTDSIFRTTGISGVIILTSLLSVIIVVVNYAAPENEQLLIWIQSIIIFVAQYLSEWAKSVIGKLNPGDNWDMLMFRVTHKEATLFDHSLVLSSNRMSELNSHTTPKNLRILLNVNIFTEVYMEYKDNIQNHRAIDGVLETVAELKTNLVNSHDYYEKLSKVDEIMSRWTKSGYFEKIADSCISDTFWYILIYKAGRLEKYLRNQLSISEINEIEEEKAKFMKKVIY